MSGQMCMCVGRQRTAHYPEVSTSEGQVTITRTRGTCGTAGKVTSTRKTAVAGRLQTLFASQLLRKERIIQRHLLAYGVSWPRTFL